MSETTEGFKPIESQEELDGIIKDRLKRERETTQKRYEGWFSPEDYNKALEDANKALDDFKKARESDAKTIEDLTAKNKAYETASMKSRIAREVGLSYEWVDRISGDDEKSIRADAESLKKLVGNSPVLPTKSTETPQGDAKDMAYKSVLNGLKKNE